MYSENNPSLRNNSQEYSYQGLLLSPFFFYPFVLTTLLIVFIPENIFKQYPIFWEAYLKIKFFLPLIENQAAYSEFPNTTRIYLAVAWILMPFQIYIVTRSVMQYIKIEDLVKKLNSNANGVPPKYLMPFGLPIINIIFILGFYLGKDPSFCHGCVNNNRLGMHFFWGVVIPLASGTLLANNLKYIFNLKKIYFGNS